MFSPSPLLISSCPCVSACVSVQGLHVFTVTARLSAEARGNATARAYLRAQAEHLGGSLSDPSGTGALRFELMEHRAAATAGTDGASGDDQAFTALLVHWQRAEEAVLPAFLQPHLPVVVAVQRYRTVFPGRSGWAEAPPTAEPGELGEIGRVSLLVQQTTLSVHAADADAFRRLWPDLGYNALGEPGLVRCDLLEQVADGEQEGATATFVSRKVFRHATALAAHEASEHAQRWREATAPLLAGKDGKRAVTMLNTLHPRTSPHPFRSRWATVGA